jgi:hypothetical protein
MAVNRYKPHVFLLPEDKQEEDIINGFFTVGHLPYRKDYQVLPLAGGWPKIRLQLSDTLHTELRRYPNMHLIIAADFDKRENRYEDILAGTPADLRERVMLIAPRDEPKDLVAAIGKSRETIGRELAQACFDRNDGLWASEHLVHNTDERQRVGETMRNLIFRTDR